MGSLLNPREVAWVLAKPFLLILGGLALLLTALYLTAGQDPTVPVSSFIWGSFDALLPFIVFLSALWIYYVIVYDLADAYARDLWIVVLLPHWFAGFLRRHWVAFGRDSILPVSPISPFSPVRLLHSRLPGLQAMGWRPGDSAQLE